MAARLNYRHAQSTRDLIDAQGIVQRLNMHIRGDIELSKTQVAAAKILLDKSIGNAPSEINIGGQADNPVVSLIKLVALE